MEPEVGGPGGVDDQGNTVLVSSVGQTCDVTDGADVRRVADEHRSCLRVRRQGAADGLGRDAERETGPLVDLGADPHRHQAGQHEPDQHGPVQGPADDDRVALASDRERHGLVGVGGAAGGEAAEVRAPEPGCPRLRIGEHAGRQLHRVESGVQGYVAGDHVPDQVGALLVARDGERRRRTLLEAEPGIEQRGVTAQAAGVSRHRASTCSVRRRGRSSGRGPAGGRPTRRRRAAHRRPGRR